MIECPGAVPDENGKTGRRCRKRNPLGTKTCSNCGQSLKRGGGLVYWIEWREEGRKKRQRIGPSKEAAELRLGEIRKALVEERHIDRDKGARMCLGELVRWYLSLPEVQAKKSYKRDQQLLAAITRYLGEKTLVKDISEGLMDGYATQRLSEDSPARKGEKIKPATVNKERMQLNTALNRAVSHRKLIINPLSGKMKKLNEDNIRERVLTEGEFEQLLGFLSSPLREMTLVAYYLGMRQREIVELNWDQMDLDRNIIGISGENPKTGFKRRIPIHPRVREMFFRLPRGIHTKRVFLNKERPIRAFVGSFKRQWYNAIKAAGLGDFTFHDLRHCAINNLRLAGNDHFTIMTISGHRTTSVFRRYNVVTDEELQEVKWKTEKPVGGRIGGQQPRKIRETG